MTQKPTHNPSKKATESIFHVIMEVKPAIILGRKQTITMPHGVYIFEDILHPKNNSPEGIKIFASLPALNIDRAVSRARGVANILLDQFTFLTKTSIPEIRIMTAYDVTPGKKKGKFIQYFYDLPFAPESLRKLGKGLLKKSSKAILDLGEVDNQRVTRAMQWFRLATKSTNSLERFTCLWVGLETINLTLCRHYEIETEYSICECCNKKVPILTGVKKLFGDSGDKNLSWRKVSKLRATTLHGSKPIHEIASDLRKTIPSLENALYNGLNLIIGLEGSGESIMNIGNPQLAHWISTATIEGPNLELIDKVFIPRFDYVIGVVYTSDTERYLSFEQKPVIDAAFRFKNEKHTYMAQPDFAGKVTFLN
ncbi:MAG: hypothetical protein ACTSR9_17470 [Candidatus Thorarchaeota archaeon]